MKPQTLRQFFKRRAIIGLIVLMVCLFVFVYAMQIASVSVMTDEAMKARVQYAIGSDATMQTEDYLSRFFSQEYIDSGELQALRARFQGVTITSYLSLSTSSWVWTWPWGGRAYVKVSDQVKGLVGDVLDPEDTQNVLPTWPSGTYALSMKKVKGAWVITKMELIELDATPTLSILPVTTPTPAP